jgi:hypothetical protein
MNENPGHVQTVTCPRHGVQPAVGLAMRCGACALAEASRGSRRANDIHVRFDLDDTRESQRT